MVKPNETEILTGSSVADLSGSTKPIFIGKFRLIGLLGEGAMGKVVRAEDTKLKRQVALKCLKRKSGKTTTYGDEQFIREARSAATLDHPGIVRIYEIGEVGQQQYIAMELIEGGSLGALYKACGRFDLQRACQLTAEAAEALAYAHQLGVVHRDIKLDNLMLTRSGRCKVTDFGLARIDDPADGFAMPNGAVGTPAYMAPEVIAGSAATAKSDVYSLAVVLFVLLTGKTPFQSRDKSKVLRMHIEMPAPDIRTIVPELPESMAKTLLRAMAKDPSDRPTADTFAKQLRAHTIPVGASQSLTASGSFQPLPATPPAKSSRWLLFGPLIAGTVVVAVVVAAMSVVLLMRSSPTSTAPAVHENPPLAPVATENEKIAAAPVTPPPAVPALVPTPAPVAAARPLVSRSETSSATLLPIIEVKDTAALRSAAEAGRIAVVAGTISDLSIDSSRNRAVLSFGGTTEVQAIFPQSLSSSMSKRFGGHYGAELIGKTVRITGIASMIDGKPSITIAHAKDVELTH